MFISALFHSTYTPQSACAAYRDEIAAMPSSAAATTTSAEEHVPSYHHDNPYFAHYDAALYHCVLRAVQPRRVVEVGAGWSTLVAARALTQNERDSGVRANLTAIDLRPMAGLERVEGVTRVVAGDVQTLSRETFSALQDGDVLFVDGSHVLHLHSDVRYMVRVCVSLLALSLCVRVCSLLLPS